MAITTKEVRGSIAGRTVLLEDDPGLPNGQAVTVRLTALSTVRPPSDDAARERLRRAAGAWADDVEGLDRYLEWNRQQRKDDRREIEG